MIWRIPQEFFFQDDFAKNLKDNLTKRKLNSLSQAKEQNSQGPHSNFSPLNNRNTAYIPAHPREVMVELNNFTIAIALDGLF